MRVGCWFVDVPVIASGAKRSHSVMTVMKIAASFCSQQETRFAFGITFIVIAQYRPSVVVVCPLRMTRTSRAVFVTG